MWTTLIFGGIAALFVALALASLWHSRWVGRLPALATLPQSTPSPLGKFIRCSVVIAARDEEARIEQTVRRLLAQHDIEVEFIIVDDRSKDRTGEILQRLAQEDDRIKVKRVDILPDGWLGKCHACHLGASAATGDWILFTDADCWMKRDVIARAARLADRDGADHVTICPGLDTKNSRARAWYLLFLTSISSWFSGVNQNRPKSHMGCGAFNMVRAVAYRQCGGYEALRLTVVDDVKLGLLLVRAGKRTRACLGGDDVECHWGTTVWSMVKLIEKNNFAALDFKLGPALAGCAVVIGLFAILFAGLLSGTAIGFAAALSPLALILPATILARKMGWVPFCAVYAPFMIPVIVYALLNSIRVTLRHGGIRWRDTFYSLEVLRAGNVR